MIICFQLLPMLSYNSSISVPEFLHVEVRMDPVTLLFWLPGAPECNKESRTLTSEI